MNGADASYNTAVGFDAGQNLIAGDENIYLGDSAGTWDDAGNPGGDETGVIRIGSAYSGTVAAFMNGIFPNFQPVGGNVVEVTIDLANDRLGWDVGLNQANPAVQRSAPRQRSAPLPRSKPLPPEHPQRQAMLNDKVEKLQVVVQMQQKQIVAQHKQMDTLTAQLREQAAQIQKVSAQIEVNKPAPQVVTNKP